MNIYKLQYDTKAQGDADLLAKGTYEVIEGEQVYRNGTQAIVYLGKIVEVPATYDKDGKELTDGTRSENKIIHGDNLEALKSLLPEYEGKIKCIWV